MISGKGLDFGQNPFVLSKLQKNSLGEKHLSECVLFTSCAKRRGRISFLLDGICIPFFFAYVSDVELKAFLFLNLKVIFVKLSQQC